MNHPIRKYHHTIGDIMVHAATKVPHSGWKGYIWKNMVGGSIVTGCVPDGVYTKGFKKGEPRLSKPIPGTRMEVIVTDQEMDQTALEYEQTTGKCWNCKGTGQEHFGWSAAEGRKYRTCSSCHGTGHIEAKEVADHE